MKFYLFAVFIFYYIFHDAVAQNGGTSGLLSGGTSGFLNQLTKKASGLQPEKDNEEKILDLSLKYLKYVPNVLGIKSTVEKGLQLRKA